MHGFASFSPIVQVLMEDQKTLQKKRRCMSIVRTEQTPSFNAKHGSQWNKP